MSFESDRKELLNHKDQDTRLNQARSFAVEHSSEIELIAQHFPGQLIVLAHRSLSRVKGLSSERFVELAKLAHKLGLKVSLTFDLLPKESQFRSLIDQFFILINQVQIDEVRVLDHGLMHFFSSDEFVKRNKGLKRSFALHLLLERGYHNSFAIKTVCRLIGPEAITLSQELPLAFLQDLSLISELKSIKKEVTLISPILLFYSPRPLLEKELPAKALTLERKVSSEESAHKNFTVYQSVHGTLMYHLKDLDHGHAYQDLYDCGLSFYSDLRHLNLEKRLKLWPLARQATWNEFLDLYPRGLFKGFLRTNKTDVLFKKLKNSHLAIKEGMHYWGKVLDHAKSKYTIIETHKPHSMALDQDQFDSFELKMHTPDGLEKTIKLEILEVLSPKLLKAKPVHRALSQSQLYTN